LKTPLFSNHPFQVTLLRRARSYLQARFPGLTFGSPWATFKSPVKGSTTNHPFETGQWLEVTGDGSINGVGGLAGGGPQFQVVGVGWPVITRGCFTEAGVC